MSSAPFTVALGGDCILNRRVSSFMDEGPDSLVHLFRSADYTQLHFESTIHDFQADGVFPTAEAGWTWMRSPEYAAQELVWLGANAISLASNHAMDYSYGGLSSTRSILEEAGLAVAGTGANLGIARSPAFVECRDGWRVAMLSATTSFARSSRAGAAGDQLSGRPGINPLGYHYGIPVADRDAWRDRLTRLGLWVYEHEDALRFHPAGLHNSTVQMSFVQDEKATLVVDDIDRSEILASITDAKTRADVVVMHLHNHEWEPGEPLTTPPTFVCDFARSCVQAGATMVVVQGSHAPLRGAEIFEGGAIFYDPGDLFLMNDTVEHYPADFYHSYGPESSRYRAHALPGEALATRAANFGRPFSPQGGYQTGPGGGGFVPICEIDAEGRLSKVLIYPFTWGRDRVGRRGVPERLTGEDGEALLRALADLSAGWRFPMKVHDSVGTVSNNCIKRTAP